MPRDGYLPRAAAPTPGPARPPTLEEILRSQRNDLAAHLFEAEAAKTMLINELVAARRRIAELEKQLAPVEPADASAAGL